MLGVVKIRYEIDGVLLEVFSAFLCDSAVNLSVEAINRRDAEVTQS